MGKDGFLTPKAISNRIKAKGLQKLQWYCQMCQKQCRDANGFKCHKESESHQRMMALFAEDANKFVKDFSNEFLAGYLDVLSRRFGTSLVKANTVYQEYIKDRHHIHMNATKWTTLSEFAKFLGREGLCVVEEKEEGFYLSYIDQATIERKKRARDMELDLAKDEDREARRAEKQMRKALQHERAREGPISTLGALIREKDQPKIALSLKSRPISTPAVAKRPALSNGDESKVHVEPVKSKEFSPREPHTGANHQWESRKDKDARTDYWLAKGIAVKVLSKDIRNGDFYGAKGEVVDVLDRYIATVKMFDEDVKLKIDQEELETVIPKRGGAVLILNGAYRGSTAEVDSLNVDEYSVQITITSGPHVGRAISAPYEDVSRLLQR